MDLLSRIPESAPVKQAWRAFASQDGFSQIKQLFAVEAIVDGAMWDVFAHAFFAGAARAAEEAGSVWEPQLDAARAETEAVRRERDALAQMGALLMKKIGETAERAGRAEGIGQALAEGLAAVLADDDLSLNEQRRWKAVLDRARALGIGEKEKAGG